MTLTVFLVRESPDTRITGGADGSTVLGWGVQFPSGWCMVEWNRTYFEEDDRLDNPHISQYGSLADVEQGTGGTATVKERYEWGDP